MDTATQDQTTPVMPAAESDFSPRKMRIAAVVMIGTLFGSSILPFMAYSLLLTPMTSEFGWSATAYSWGYTALMWCGALVQQPLGRIVDRAGVRPMIIGGTCVVGLLVIAMSRQSGALWQFYLFWGLLGVVGTTAIAYSKVIAALFGNHRGKALAIFGIESSLAGAAALQISNWLLQSYGWRGMFVGMGCIILAVVPLLWWFLEEPAAPAATPAQAHDPRSLPGMTTGEVLRTRAFWMIAVASFLAVAPSMGLMPHYVPYLVSRGFDASHAALMLTVSTVTMAAGTFVGGWAIDRSTTARIAAPFSVLSTLALVMMILASVSFGGIPLLLAAGAVLGFAGGAKRPMATYFHSRYFGLRSFTEVSGIQGMFMAIGMGVAAPAVGYCYDRLHSYLPALWFMAGSLALTVLLYLLLPRYYYDKDFTAAG
ncbi:MAG: MFS transporter [Gammaproteobacteria bacterium]|nr:MFS transporter [Gammaproteobacteria bacterium]